MRSSITELDGEGWRLATAAIDHPAALELQPAILQALECLERGLELSCWASSKINTFIQCYKYTADDSLSACVRGLNWLFLRLAALDAVRRFSISRWVRHIREGATDVALLALGDALDEGLRARALNEPLEESHRTVLVSWLTAPGPEREQPFEEAVRQLLGSV